MHLALPHMSAGGKCYAALARVVHRTIEMINGAVVLHHITLMREHFIVRLAGNNQVATGPVGPVHQIVAGGEGVVGIILAGGIESREIEHHVDRILMFCVGRQIHLNQLGVASDGAIAVVSEDRITIIPLPFLQVFRQGNANTLTFRMGGVLASGIVVHHERIFLRTLDALLFVLYPIDGTFVLSQLLPPLCFRIVVTQYGLVVSVPWSNDEMVVFCILNEEIVLLDAGQSNAQRRIHRLVARARTADIGHPMVVFECLQLVSAAPRVVYQSRKTATLVLVP